MPRRSGISNLSKEEIEEIADQAANRAVANFLRTLDMDVHDISHIREFRRDLGFIRSQRVGSEKTKDLMKKAGWGAVAAVIPYTIFYFWEYIRLGLKELIIR